VVESGEDSRLVRREDRRRGERDGRAEIRLLIREVCEVVVEAGSRWRRVVSVEISGMVRSERCIAVVVVVRRRVGWWVKLTARRDVREAGRGRVGCLQSKAHDGGRCGLEVTRLDVMVIFRCFETEDKALCSRLGREVARALNGVVNGNE
jgi:hypothetical protein